MKSTTTQLKLSLFVAGLLALAGLGGNVRAQSTNNQAVNLPLSSVGSEVGWDQRAGAIDDYRLAVFERAANQPLRIELYSPDINLNDYRNKRNVQNYYGDEIYSPSAKVSSRFSLLERGSNSALVERNFAFSENHKYETFFQSSLVQGFYQFPVQTRGNGKNAFGFRLSPGIAIEASQFTVVTRGQQGRDQLAARLTIGEAAVGKVFRIDNFDADGASEMQLFVRFPNGQRRQLTASGDVQWAGNDIQVTPAMRGEWAILVRIIPTTKQFSNSVKFRLKLDGKPYFARMPFETGPALPRVEAPRTDLTLTKAVDSNRVNIGEKVTYTLTVVNTGPDAAANTTLTDTLPAGLGNAVSEGAQINGNRLSWNLGNLPNGERRVVTVQATATAAGTQINAAEVRTSTAETTLDNNRASVSLQVVAPPPPPPAPPRADLALTKTVAPSRIEIGQSATYTLSVTNTGKDTATNVVLSDTLPAGLEFVSTTLPGSRAGQTLTWNLGRMAVNETRSIGVTVRGLSAGERINNASVKAAEEDPNPANNAAKATLTVVAPPPPPPPTPKADLALTKTVSVSRISVGENATYTLTVVNFGGDAATNVTLTDVMPAGVELVSSNPVAQVSGANLNWNLGNLPVGERRSVTVVVRGNTAGEQINNANVKATEEDTNPNNNSAKASLMVVALPQADLALTKTVNPARVEQGAKATYTLTVTNSGPNSATGVTLTDQMPAGLEFVSATPEVSRSGATLTWNIGNVAANQSRSVTIEVIGRTVGDQINNASVRGNERDPNLTNNSAKASLTVVAPPPPTPKADISVTKVANLPRVELGQNATFTLTVGNSGTSPATNVVLTDTLPAGLDLVSSNPIAQQEGAVLTWNLGNLAVNQSRTVTLEVAGRTVGEKVNTASVKATEEDPNSANNQARASLEVFAPAPPPPAPEPKADLALTKTISDNAVNTGETVTYTLTLVNNGPDAASNVSVQDVLPQGLDNVIAEGAKREGETLIWNLGNLANGERVSLTVKAIAVLAGTLTNNATISASEPDPNPANNRARVALTVTQPVVVPQVRDVVRERESEVTLAARLVSAPSAGVVIVSDQIPANSRYVLGSSRLLRANPASGQLEQTIITNPTRENSDPIADPTISGDRLFWVLPAPLRSGYVVGYRLTHSEALEFSDDRLGVILQTPQTRSAGTPRTPNQQPVLGSLGDVRTLIGNASLIDALKTAQPIGIGARADSSAVRSGGTTNNIQVYPSRPLTTDRADQPELTILTRDAAGNPSSARYATVNVQPEPSAEDAEPTVPGFQVRLTNGEGRLPLSNLGTRLQGGTPDVVSVEVQAEGVRSQSSFPIEAAEPRPLIVSGAFGIQANFNSSGFSLESTLRGFGRGSIGDALFTGAVNTGADFGIGRSFLFRDVNLLPPANPYERFPLLGDSSQLGTDVNSSDSVFLRLELNKNYLQYGQLNTDFQGLLGGFNAGYNGLRGVIRDGNFSLNSFAAVVPNANRLETIQGDGTSFYRLGALANELPVLQNSEQVIRTVRDRNNPNLVLSRTILLRNADYEVDYSAGTLKLRQPLQPSDINGNAQSLEVAFAVSNATAQRELRGGVQAGFDNGTFGLRASLLSLGSNQSGLATVGFKIGGRDVQFEAEGAAPLNRFNLSAGAARLAVTLENFGLEARYQDVAPGFNDQRGLLSNGRRDISLGATTRLGIIGINGRYSLQQDYAAGTTQQNLSAEARVGGDNLALLVGGGASFGLTPSGITNNQSDARFLSIGGEAKAGNFGIAVRQLIGFSNTPSATDVALDLALSQNFGIRLQNRLSYTNTGLRATGSLGVRGSFANNDILNTLLGNSSEAPDPEARGLGTTNISATYDMSNLDGDAGRTRVGLDTNIPLSSQLQLGLSSSVTVAPSGQGGASGGIGLRYNSDDLQANLGLEASAQASDPGIKNVVGFGIVWKPSNDLILSPQATYVREANGTNGSRFSLAGAYRGDRFSLLTNNILKSGFYRDQDGVLFEGEVRTGLQADERFFLRLGTAYRFSDLGIFTGQVGGGMTYFFTDVFGLGVNGSYLFQPSSSTGQASFGLEGSLRFAPGFTLSAGANLIGTQTSLLGFQSQPGFYLRLDWLFNEGLFGAR